MNELYHHGVKGQKWGVNRYQDKTKQLIAKRKAIAEKKGVTSRSYRKASEKLFTYRAKAKLAKAKQNNDPDAITFAKNDLKTIRYYKRHGYAGADGQTMNRVFGNNLSRKQKEAISLNEWKRYSRNARVKSVAKKAAVVLGPIVLASATQLYNKNTSKITSKLSQEGVKNLNKVVNAYNKGVTFARKYMR